LTRNPRPSRPKGARTVFLLALAAFLLLAQEQPYGDGITYLVWLRDRNFLAHHLLYLPDLFLFTRPLVLLGASEARAAFWFSGVCMAGGLALCHRLLLDSRSLRGGREPPGGLWTFLLASSPVVVFYATQVENHAHHFFWVAAALLALDRALAGGRTSRALAGLVLAAAFASHSSFALLLPALFLLSWSRLSGGGFALRSGAFLDLALLFLPTLAFKFADPWIKADLLGGGPAYLKDRSLAFALRTMQAKSPAEWIRYLGEEVLLAAPALWLLLPAAGRRFGGGRIALALLGLLPYLLLFGNWPVEEYGAYYLPVLLLWTVLLASPPGPILLRIALFLGMFQGAVAVHLATTWVSRHPDPPWEWAADAAALGGPRTLVIAEDGLRCLHLDYDHGLEFLPLRGIAVQLLEGGKRDPEAMRRLATETLPRDLDRRLAEGQTLLVSAEGWEYLGSRFPEFRESILARYRLEKARKGRFRGFRILPRD